MNEPLDNAGEENMSASKENRDVLDDARSRLTAIYDHLDVSEDVRRQLAHAKFGVRVSVPVRRDDGSLNFYAGWRVQYDNTRGPGKGGIRFHPAVNEAEVTALGSTPPIPMSR